MGDSIVAILGGIASLGMAVAAILGAHRRATRDVQAENDRLRAELTGTYRQLEAERRQRSAASARERMAREKAEVVMYALLGVVERGEPDTGEIRRAHDAYLELASHLDNGPTQGDDQR